MNPVEIAVSWKKYADYDMLHELYYLIRIFFKHSSLIISITHKFVIYFYCEDSNGIV